MNRLYEVAPEALVTIADADVLSRRLQRVLMTGLVLLVVGMAVMPAGVSLNPGRPYQYLLGVTLYLPVLWLSLSQPQRWRAFWRQPLVLPVVALLVWGGLSLLWGGARRPLDELARDLSILLFLFAWAQVMTINEQHIRRLLAGCALAYAAAALVALAWFAWQPPADGRLVGFGVMANANLAAAAWGVAVLWLLLWPWPWPGRAGRVARAGALGVLGLCLFLTNSRSAWAALFAALLVLLLCRGGQRRWPFVLALVLAVAAAIIDLPGLLQRGWSMRPEILMGSWTLFSQQPWLGLGQGTPFDFVVEGTVLTHAHNMFSQLAIELGLPGLVLWCGIWLALGWRSWRFRHEPLGRLVLALWVFAMCIVQFDLPGLLDSPRPAWLITWLPLALSFSLGRRPSLPPVMERMR